MSLPLWGCDLGSAVLLYELREVTKPFCAFLSLLYISNFGCPGQDNFLRFCVSNSKKSYFLCKFKA